MDMMFSCYKSTLSSLLDKYAPLRTKSVANRKRVPWFNDKTKDAIKARRGAERKWRYSKSAHDLSRGDEWFLRAFASMPSTAIFLRTRAEIKNLLCELASNAKIWGARASEHSFKFCEQIKQR